MTADSQHPATPGPGAAAPGLGWPLPPAPSRPAAAGLGWPDLEAAPAPAVPPPADPHDPAQEAS